MEAFIGRRWPILLEMALSLSLTYAVPCCHHRRLFATDMNSINFAGTIKSRAECSIDVENTSSLGLTEVQGAYLVGGHCRTSPLGPEDAPPPLPTRFLCSPLRSGANLSLSECYDFIIDLRNNVSCSAAVLEGLSNGIGGCSFQMPWEKHREA